MPRGEDYSEKLKGALAANLPHLKVHAQPKDITVTQAPDGNSYRVKVVLSVPTAGHTGIFRSVTMEETYTDNEALEIKGDAYRQRTNDSPRPSAEKWQRRQRRCRCRSSSGRNKRGPSITLLRYIAIYDMLDIENDDSG